MIKSFLTRWLHVSAMKISSAEMVAFVGKLSVVRFIFFDFVVGVRCL